MIRAHLVGILIPFAVLCLLTGSTAILWPDAAIIGMFGRMLESLAPHLIVAGVVIAAAIALLGAPWLALALTLPALAGAGLNAAAHWRLAEPLASDAEADLTVIWFNLLFKNDRPPEDLARALSDSDADLVLLTEAAPLRRHWPLLEQSFPHRLGCDRRKICGIVILSRVPFDVLSFGRMTHWRPERLAVIRLQPEGAAPLSIMATHLVKPWYYGPSEEDMWYVEDELAALTGPLVVAGDFNTAPWSQRMRGLARDFGLAPQARPIATWPETARGLGVPIDHMMARGGAELVTLGPWGDGLGSNHRGLRATIALPNLADPVAQ